MSSLQDSLRGIATSAAIIFVGMAVGRVLSLLGELLIIRSLSPSVFGVIALTYTTVLMISRIGLLGIPNGLTRMLSDRTDEKMERNFVKGGYLIAFFSGSLIAVGLYLFRSEFAVLMGDERLTTLGVLFVPYVLTFPIAMVSIGILRARKLSTATVLSRDIAPRVGGILAFGAFLFFGRPFDGAVAYWVSIPLIAALFALMFLIRDNPGRNVIAGLPQPTYVRKLWAFSWPLAVSTALMTIISSADVLMIGFFLESDLVGFYRSVHPLRKVTEFVIRSFTFLFLPLATEYYASGDLSELRNLYRISSKWIALVTFPFVLVFTLFSADVVRIFLGSEYASGAIVLSVLTAGLFYNAFVGPNGAMTKAIDRPRIEMYAAGVGVIVNIGLNAILIPAIGIVGAAVATVVGYLVYNTVEVAVIYRITGAHPFTIETLKPLAPTTIVAIGLASFFGPTALGLFHLIVIGILLILLEAFMLVTTGSIEEADRWILDMLREYLRNG